MGLNNIANLRIEDCVDKSFFCTLREDNRYLRNYLTFKPWFSITLGTIEIWLVHNCDEIL